MLSVLKCVFYLFCLLAEHIQLVSYRLLSCGNEGLVVCCFSLSFVFHACSRWGRAVTYIVLSYNYYSKQEYVLRIKCNIRFALLTCFSECLVSCNSIKLDSLFRLQNYKASSKNTYLEMQTKAALHARVCVHSRSCVLSRDDLSSITLLFIFSRGKRGRKMTARSLQEIDCHV